MRVTCVQCHCRFDISNREVLEMAAKLQAGKAQRTAGGAHIAEANGNVATDNPGDSIALRFVAEKKK